MKNKRSELKVGIVLNYINLILGNLIPIFYTPIMLSLLGQSEYGLYKLSSSVTSYLSLMSLGIGSAVTRYLIKFRVENGKKGEEKILGLFVLIFQIIAFCTFVVGVVIVLNLDIWYGNSLSISQLSRMKILVFLMVCNMSISFSVSPYISATNAHEKYIFIQCMNILSTCIGPLLNLIVLWNGYSSLGMAISSLVVNLIVQALYLLYVRNILKIKANFNSLPFYLLKEILMFSFWIFVSNVGSQLCNATDIVMIGIIPALATKGVAVYNIGATFNNIVSSMSTCISSLLTPRINYLVFDGASKTELSNLMIKIGRIQAYVVSLIVFGFISFGKPFIYFYAGNGYGESYWVAVLMMIPSSIPLVQSACLSIMVALNKHKFRSIVCIFITIGNVIGTWICLPFLGVVGAALMTGVTLILGNGIILNWYYWKKLELDIPLFWKNISIIFCPPLIMCILTLFISKLINIYDFNKMILGIFIFTVVFIVINLKYVMNDYEKNLIFKPIKKFVISLIGDKK